MHSYRKLFDPDVLRAQAPAFERPRRPFVADYEYDDSIILAVNVALATHRPLLLRGDPGSGKSTLAEDVARLLHRRYYEQVVSSSLEASDLLWRPDHVSRIADAQAGDRNARERPENYVQPGTLFWAIAPDTAAKLGKHDPELRTWRLESPRSRPAVLLIDEIDKAEPDFPNDLLVPLGSLSFQVPALVQPIEVAPAMRPLVIVTTNEERDLPSAFLRRCVVLRLEVPGNNERGRSRLQAIARQHFNEAELGSDTLAALMRRYFELHESAVKARVRTPGTAEFLDAARAVVALGGADVKAFVTNNEWAFRELTQAALWKHRESAPGSGS